LLRIIIIISAPTKEPQKLFSVQLRPLAAILNYENLLSAQLLYKTLQVCEVNVVDSSYEHHQNPLNQLFHFIAGKKVLWLAAGKQKAIT